MALYTWLSSPPGECLFDHFGQVLDDLGLQICQEASSEQQIFATEVATAGMLQSNKVNVTVSWASSSKRTCQVEVRSSEPMFKRDTRCEKLAEALRSHAPPTL